MSYDPVHHRVLLFGGAFWSDTWSWDGAAWSSQLPVGWAAIPGGGLDFDPVRGCTILYGGGQGYQERLMEWDGYSWSQRLTYSMLVRGYSPMVYDTSRHCMILFGGYGSDATGYSSSRAWGDLQQNSPSSPRAARRRR